MLAIKEVYATIQKEAGLSLALLKQIEGLKGYKFHSMELMPEKLKQLSHIQELSFSLGRCKVKLSLQMKDNFNIWDIECGKVVKSGKMEHLDSQSLFGILLQLHNYMIWRQAESGIFKENLRSFFSHEKVFSLLQNKPPYISSLKDFYLSFDDEENHISDEMLKVLRGVEGLRIVGFTRTQMVGSNESLRQSLTFLFSGFSYSLKYSKDKLWELTTVNSRGEVSSNMIGDLATLFADLHNNLVFMSFLKKESGLFYEGRGDAVRPADVMLSNTEQLLKMPEMEKVIVEGLEGFYFDIPDRAKRV